MDVVGVPSIEPPAPLKALNVCVSTRYQGMVRLVQYGGHPQMHQAMPKLIVYLFALGLAMGALPMPYGYYVFLRLSACTVFAFAAYVAVTRKHRTLPWIYGALAIAFNPAVKVILPKSVWAVIDVAAALLMVMTAKHIASDRASH